MKPLTSTTVVIETNKKTGKIKDVLLLGWTADQTIRVQLKAQNVPDDDHHIYIVFLISDI